MLSKKDKKEIIKDGCSQARRRHFAKAKLISQDKGLTLDEYIRFLDGIQAVFPTACSSKEKPITTNNKL